MGGRRTGTNGGRGRGSNGRSNYGRYSRNYTGKYGSGNGIGGGIHNWYQQTRLGMNRIAHHRVGNKYALEWKTIGNIEEDKKEVMESDSKIG